MFWTTTGRKTRSLLAIFAATVITPACFADEDPGEEGDETGTGGSDGGDAGDDGSSAGDDGSGTADGGGQSCNAPDGELAGSCPDDQPFCQDQKCVSCAALPVATCATVDPSTPACDPDSGRCVQCTDVNGTECTGVTPACVNNECVGCTSNDQCETGQCLLDGSCLAEEVVLDGTVVKFQNVTPTPKNAAKVLVRNVEDIADPPPTMQDGAFQVRGVPPFSLVQLAVEAPHDDVSFFIPASLRTVWSIRVENDTPVSVAPPFVSYGWMARVAFECGIFPTLADAEGNGAVNVYFTQRSTIVGRLVDKQGDPVPTIGKTGVQIEVDGRNNVSGGTEDPSDNPATLCFLEEQTDGELHGTPNASSGSSGYFVMFRVQDDQGTGAGVAVVTANGFDPVSIKLKSTGEVGVIELVRNDSAIQRDFETEVYPIFTSHGCIGCHTPGSAVWDQIPVRSGFEPNWSADPDMVYMNLTGPGTMCPDAMGEPRRICVNDPTSSLLLRRPLAEMPGDPEDVHPVDIFPSIDDPAAQVIVQWIEQGAMRGTPQEPVDFTDDVYPIFTKYGCAGCHNPGSAVWDQIPVRMGFEPNWSDEPMKVWENLTGPGTMCSGPDEQRVCLNRPLDSLIVTRPLTDPPNEPDVHPVDIFGSTQDPDLALIIRWINEGAKFMP